MSKQRNVWEDLAREEIVRVCGWLHNKNLLSSADGNVSVRLEDGRILITPTGVPKFLVKPEDLAVITLDNQIISGAPSGERLMHLEVYRRCPEAKAVVHAHPPVAVAWSVAEPSLSELPSDSLSEVILAVGSIPIVAYARPGTSQMAERLVPYLPGSRVMILARHGALSWGETMTEAYGGMERLEHSAMILKYARELGGLSSLPGDELKWLRETRKKMGNKTL